MKLTTWNQWCEWWADDQYTVLPFIVKHPNAGCGRIASWEEAWKAGSQRAFVLESGKAGRYTYLGLETKSVISGTGQDGQIETNEGKTTATQTFRLPPLEAVRRWMAPHRSPKVPGAPPFTGGCVGFWGYDVVRHIERLPVIAAADLPLPDYIFYRVDRLWIVDHQEDALYCAVHMPVSTPRHTEQMRSSYMKAEDEAARMKRMWDGFHGVASRQIRGARESCIRSSEGKHRLHNGLESLADIKTAFGKPQFIRAVERIQEYIRTGDVFQVNLSLRQSRPVDSSPEDIYEWLRLFNPSPYMGLFKHERFQLVSASPELLVRVRGEEVSTRPIAGTRRRGRSDADDRAMAEELLGNEKERAEHIMLVDLLRNDIGRISRYGSVQVPELMVLEYYSHVMHLVSEVRGKIAPEHDLYDVIAAVFPGGTITGAPKIRTMEIIEELEPTRRGPYTGSMGWIDFAGDMEFNIIIRTLTLLDQVGYIQAGAGIVIDSIPDREYKESLQKAKALWKAIEFSESLRAGTLDDLIR